MKTEEDEEMKKVKAPRANSRAVKAKAEPAENKKAEPLPKVGEKRKTRPKVDNDSDVQEEIGVKLKRKNDGEVEKKIVKRVVKKKVPAKPTEFKAGKWNPNTELVKVDIDLWDDSKNPIFECCHRCNGRNVFRAINTNNVALLRKLVYDK